MSEKFYVVSESELEALRYAGYMDIQTDLDKAEAACRARPIPEDTLKVIFLRSLDGYAEYEVKR